MRDVKQVQDGVKTTTMHIKCVDEDYEHGEFSLEVTETETTDD